MKRLIIFGIFISVAFLSLFSFGQDSGFKPARVDFDAYEKLVKEVKDYRKTRLLNTQQFLKASLEEQVIILDTRSDEMYQRKHIKGAVHLNFSDFTQTNLAKIIPSFHTKVLIYCNNNIDNDEKNFPVKAKGAINAKEDVISLALNIPTYINLYGYGYRNVFELSELVSVSDKRVSFEGTSVKVKK